jgi:ABC-type transport system substrate-binding protein
MDELRRSDLAAAGIRVQFRPAKWPENMKNLRAGRLMLWSLGSNSAQPDSQDSIDMGASTHIGGQNYARFRHARFDAAHARINALPDGEDRLALIEEAKRLMTAFMPYKVHVHRIYTDLAQAWLHGYRRPPFCLRWWHCVDIDAQAQAEQGT